MKLIIWALSACAVFGQDVSRVFPFHHTEGEKNLQEVGVLVRTLAELRQVDVDTTAKTLSMSGPESKIQIAEWLLKELDRTAAPDSVTKEFSVTDNDLVRVYYLANTPTIQGFQEIATLVRTLAEIRMVFTYNAPRALAIRGTADQVAAASWMVQELDQPAEAPHKDTAVHKMLVSGRDDGTDVRIFYAPTAATIQQFQEQATLIRTIAEVRRVFTYNLSHAIAVRGNPDQIATAGWLIHELAKPVEPTAVASDVYRMADDSHHENIVRVFYIKDATTVQAFQQLATQIRTTTQIRRVFTYNASMAMALRGTPEQLAMAEQMLKDRQLALK
jgi:hypothetical protein